MSEPHTERFTNNASALTGLGEEEVILQRQKDGRNEALKAKNPLIQNILSAASEPMFILLTVACAVYFLLKETTEAITMLVALLFVLGIDVFQNFRSQRAVKALSQL